MRIFCLLAASLLMHISPARAESPPPIEVDVELLLAVDVSRSMNTEELDIQRRGYAAALRSPEVIHTIEHGMIGQVAVAYVEWAGSQQQNVIVDWTLISNAEEAEAFAKQLDASQRMPYRTTSISAVLEFGRTSIQDNQYEGLRKVIDISGDGPNNQGAPVVNARDAVVRDGIVVNGLPLMTGNPGNPWETDALDAYYRSCVIGGPASFVIAVHDWSQFATAVHRKMVLELVGVQPPAPDPTDEMRVIPAFAPGQAKPDFDCDFGYAYPS